MAERELYLGDQTECVLCSLEERKGQNRLTRDHVITRLACKQHNSLLGPTKDQPFNLATLCREHHDRVDRQKTIHYREKGLVALVEAVANYPRCPQSSFYEIQQRQWIKLFGGVGSSLLHLNGSAPPHLLSIYSQATDLIFGYLYRWERGDFNLLLPA